MVIFLINKVVNSFACKYLAWDIFSTSGAELRAKERAQNRFF